MASAKESITEWKARCARIWANRVVSEVERATAKHGPMASAHEGYAVLLEEVDELWEEIKAQHRNNAMVRKEAVQVAAMAIRLLVDVYGFEGTEQE